MFQMFALRNTIVGPQAQHYEDGSVATQANTLFQSQIKHKCLLLWELCSSSPAKSLSKKDKLDRK